MISASTTIDCDEIVSQKLKYAKQEQAVVEEE